MNFIINLGRNFEKSLRMAKNWQKMKKKLVLELMDESSVKGLNYPRVG